MNDNFRPTAIGATRRQFGREMSLATAGFLLAVPAGAEPPGSKPPASAPERTPAQMLTELLRQRYPKHLSEEQWAEVHKSINRNQSMAAALKRFKLENGDEPSFAFTVD